MRKHLAVFLLALHGAAHAVTLVVDTGADTVLSACTAAPGDCTLRGAITAANSTPAADVIEFAIPQADPSYQSGTDSWLILVGATALPGIEAPVLIDGYSQPGASANTNTPIDGGLNSVLKIELRPATPPVQFNGLEISLNFFAQPASTIRGLAISRFPVQIFLAGSSAHRVEGCFLGTNVSGTAAAVTGNSGLGSGIRPFGPGGYVIGGSSPGARNLVSGMSGAITSFSANDGIVIQGNLIGTDISGTQAIGHAGNAIESSGPLTNALIGGTDPNARNVISASRFSAIYLSTSNVNPYTGTRIVGNYIGTDVSGLKPLGNGLNLASPTQTVASVYLFSGNDSNLAIGGLLPGEANLIAYGGAAGLQVATSRGVSSPLNHYRGNRVMAIDNSETSNADGPSPNDAGDADTGGNRKQNFPVYSLPGGFLPVGGSAVTVNYTVDTAVANASYPLTIRAYRGDCGGGSRSFIASETIEAVDAQLPQTWVLTAPDGGNVLPLVFTATDAAGNNSEFSTMAGEAIFADALENQPPVLTPGNCR